MQKTNPFGRIRRKHLHRLAAASLILTAFLGILSRTVFAGMTYVITDGDLVLVHTTASKDPAQVLSEAGVDLGVRDIVTAQPGDGVSEITISRLQSILVHNGGQTQTVTTYGTTVSALLAELQVHPGENVKISHDLAAQTQDGMEITVTYVTYREQEELLELPYSVAYCADASLAPEEEKTLTEGTPGQILRRIRVALENGVETNQEVLEERVLMPPVNAVIARGIDRSARLHEAPTRKPSETPRRKAAESKQEAPPSDSGNTLTTASGAVIPYLRKLTVEATAYSCEGYTGTTATGTRARYGAIAVDPKVIPYGTRMYIVSDDGAYVYGYATAEDCGGGIKGNRIDLYFDTVDECWQFGRRSCTVYILE